MHNRLYALGLFHDASIALLLILNHCRLRPSQVGRLRSRLESCLALLIATLYILRLNFFLILLPEQLPDVIILPRRPLLHVRCVRLVRPVCDPEEGIAVAVVLLKVLLRRDQVGHHELIRSLRKHPLPLLINSHWREIVEIVIRLVV